MTSWKDELRAALAPARLNLFGVVSAASNTRAARFGLTASLLVLLVSLEALAGEKRIVSLAPSITETLFAIGAGEEVVGVTDACRWPPEAVKIPRVGSYLGANVEAVVARRPSVVIAVPGVGNRSSLESLEALGLRVVAVQEGPTLEDVFASMRSIAAEAEREEEGKRLLERLRREIASIHEKIKAAKPKRVLLILNRDPVVAVGEGTFIDELLRLAGGKNAANGLGPWPRLSVEHMIQTSPEIVLDATLMGDESSPDPYFYQQLELTAARENRIYSGRFDQLLRPGPSLGSGLEKLARLLHPELFE